MNDDFEGMLIFAAKAVGIEVVGDQHPPDGLNVCIPRRNYTYLWQPLADDGDAFRLAITLNLKVKYHSALGQALVISPYGKEHQVNVEECNRDPNAATRLAIVMAAASIGENK